MRAELNPRGTLVTSLSTLGRGDPLARFAKARDALGDNLFAAAFELGRLVPESAPGSLSSAVLALGCACLWTGARGSTRIPIGEERQGALHEALAALSIPDAERAAVFRMVKEGADRGAASALFGQPGDFRPFVVSGGAVYTERMWRLEGSIAERLRARLGSGPLPVVAATERHVSDVLARHATRDDRPIVLSAEQRWAMVAAAFQHLTIVSGGPGTGKTSIVVSMLRLLVRLGVDPSAIALAAPTGKAANRLEESIVGYLRAIAAPAPEDTRLLEARLQPATLHRLLGYSQRRGTFQHHAKNPLAAAVVIVDEASMIDLALMDHLLRAVAPDARLVLLGDAEQLPSVDAGAVLRDLVPAKPRRPPRPWDALVPEPAVTPGEVRDLRDTGAVRMTHSYRMDESDPDGRAIYLVSLAVRSGVLPEVVTTAPLAGNAGNAGSPGAALVARGRPEDVEFRGAEIFDGDADARRAFLARWFDERFVRIDGFLEHVAHVYTLTAEGALGDSDAARLRRLQRTLQSSRVLCLYRHAADEAGVRAVNATVARALAALRDDDDAEPGPLQPGTPVLMTQNDYALGLFNGDTGVAVLTRAPGRSAPSVRLAFEVRGALRFFERAGLEGRVEPAWAMTVHKAQGSELEHVALMLPRLESAAESGETRSLLCREVVYTAMTRAKRSITIVGGRDALDEAVRRGIERESGLADPGRWAV